MLKCFCFALLFVSTSLFAQFTKPPLPDNYGGDICYVGLLCYDDKDRPMGYVSCSSSRGDCLLMGNSVSCNGTVYRCPNYL